MRRKVFQNTIMAEMFKTLLAVSLVVFISSCGTTKTIIEDVIPSNDDIKTHLILVGTYSDGSNGGLYSFKMNVRDNLLEQTAVANISNPSYMYLDRQSSILYMVNENQKQPSVTSASLNSETGEIEIISTSPTLSESPCYISMKNGKLVTANYGGGSITLYSPTISGKLGTPTWRIEMGPKGISHPHSVTFSRDGKELFVTDLGQDKIFNFRVNASTPPLTTVSDAFIETPDKSGPRHFIFNKRGNVGYLINELSGTIIVYNYKDGELHEIQDLSISDIGGGAGGHIALSPDEKYLYASNRDVNDGISIFKVSSNGLLTNVGFTKTDIHPRHFAFSPKGKYLAVACTKSNTVEIYRRNKENGSLSLYKKIENIRRPAYIEWLYVL